MPHKAKIDALNIFQAALNAACPVKCVKRNVQLKNEELRVGEKVYDLRFFSKIVIVGAGKASASMASAVEDILEDRITGGVINTKHSHLKALKRIELREAGHPIPDKRGVEGTEKIIKLLKEADEKTLVLCLISGGGSALMPSPVRGISLDDKQRTTQLLLECGATIEEVNTIRKHLSRIKGGKLCQIAKPAQVVALILSDVIGDRLDIIASGPTVPDETTLPDCLNILRKYSLIEKIPKSVLNYLQSGEIETFKEERLSSNCQNLIVGNNFLAVKAAVEKAISLGYNSLLLSTQIQGEAKEVAKFYASLGKEVLTSGNPIPPPACIIGGGETTVTIRGRGLGGRNQELVLSGALQIKDTPRITILSAGTDGTDGPTDAAGAIADGETVRKAEDIKLQASKYLEDNNSYNFFKKLGDLITTGPTGTNVMDLQLVVVV